MRESIIINNNTSKPVCYNHKSFRLTFPSFVFVRLDGMLAVTLLSN